jgi:hypothetical protein
LATEDGELVAQDQDLQVLGGVAANKQYEHLNRATQCEVGEFRQHPSDLCGGEQKRHSTEPSFGASRQLATTYEFAHPTGHQRRLDPRRQPATTPPTIGTLHHLQGDPKGLPDVVKERPAVALVDPALPQPWKPAAVQTPQQLDRAVAVAGIGRGDVGLAH